MKYILIVVLLVVSAVLLYYGITENAVAKIVFAAIGVVGFSILLFYALRRRKV